MHAAFEHGKCSKLTTCALKDNWTSTRLHCTIVQWFASCYKHLLYFFSSNLWATLKTNNRNKSKKNPSLLLENSFTLIYTIVKCYWNDKITVFNFHQFNAKNRDSLKVICDLREIIVLSNIPPKSTVQTQWLHIQSNYKAVKKKKKKSLWFTFVFHIKCSNQKLMKTFYNWVKCLQRTFNEASRREKEKESEIYEGLFWLKMKSSRGN